MASNPDDQTNRANVFTFSSDINSAVRRNRSDGTLSDMEIIFGTSKPSDDQSKTASLWSSSPNAFSSNTNSVVDMMGAQMVSSGVDSFHAFDQLLVKQTVKASNLFGDYRGNKEFIIKNSTGQNVFKAVECTSYLKRNVVDQNTAFNMYVMDMNGREIVHFKSSTRVLPVVKVKLPNDQTIGYVERDFTLAIPKFTIKNGGDETILRIEGPFNTFSFGGNIDFDILNLGGAKIGKISKQWSGLAREFFTDSDYFGIKFPINLDVNMKATLLGACMLIDATYYSK